MQQRRHFVCYVTAHGAAMCEQGVSVRSSQQEENGNSN